MEWAIDHKNIKLKIELVPRTSFFTNLRSELTRSQWDYVRKAVYARANYVCEICGGKGTKHPVEAHEEWYYEELHGIQKLTKIVALCPACHEVKHIGLAGLKGNGPRALAHLKKVNEWNDAQVEVYMGVIWEYWNMRNTIQWTLDISLVTDWLEAQGIE